MKIQRLRVAELRRFRDPFELRDLAPGLNVFAGPNETGKSTLVRAIRAAFFERHRSTSVEDLRPWGDSAATPTVELDFSVGGTPYRLTKSFLQKKRCELLAGTRRLDGAEAEDHLAALLGFQFALKGASRDEHWGIPGLLWIEQGRGQEIDRPVEHAAAHLQRALNASVGEVAASGGDAVLATLRAQRGELLTAAGKPRGAYAEAVERADALAAAVAEADAALRRHAEQVDRLKRLRDEHAAEAREAPWAALRAALATAEAALAQAEGLQREREVEHAAERQAAGMVELLRGQIDGAAKRQAELAARDAALAGALQRQEAAAAAEALAARAHAAAAARQHSARATLALARREDNRARLGRELAAARELAHDAAARLANARDAQTGAAVLEREAAALALAPAELKALRDAGRLLHELRIRQDAVATRIAWDLAPGSGVALGGEALAGRGERRLAEAATLALPGGTVTIVPGGDDLAALVREHAKLADEERARLQRLGLASLEEAEARAAQHALKAQDAKAAAQALALVAPKGVAALEGDAARAAARRAEAEQALAALPPAPAETPPPVAAAEAAADDAEARLADAARQADTARRTKAGADSEADAARRERDALAAALADPAVAAELRDRRIALVDAQARLEAAQSRLAAVDARIAAARPEILRQDVARLRASAEQAERAHRERDRAIVALEAELAAAGAQGLDEQAAAARAACEQAAKRRAELERRAAALDLLVVRLDAKRQALTRRLQAPLQKHLDHYASLLFPGARLELGEALLPETLARGAERGDFGALSFGSREQLALICRLAYADLLREAGRPTLVILDDALVHSDDARLDRMKRIVFDAATRHQLLLFSCHPQWWRDLGVPVRMLADEGLRAAA